VTLSHKGHHIQKIKTRGVSHRGLAIYIKKNIKAKQESKKTQILHHAKKYNFSKIQKLKRNQNPSRYIITL